MPSPPYNQPFPTYSSRHRSSPHSGSASPEPGRHSRSSAYPISPPVDSPPMYDQYASRILPPLPASRPQNQMVDPSDLYRRSSASSSNSSPRGYAPPAPPVFSNTFTSFPNAQPRVYRNSNPQPPPPQMQDRQITLPSIRAFDIPSVPYPPCPAPSPPSQSERRSTVPRPYVCATCTFAFTRSHDLSRHLMTHNKDKKLFHCETCPKSFSRKDALKRHVTRKRCGMDDEEEEESHSHSHSQTPSPPQSNIPVARNHSSSYITDTAYTYAHAPTPAYAPAPPAPNYTYASRPSYYQGGRYPG